MKKGALWTSAAIASSFLCSTLILGTPTFAAENKGSNPTRSKESNHKRDTSNFPFYEGA